MPCQAVPVSPESSVPARAMSEQACPRRASAPGPLYLYDRHCAPPSGPEGVGEAGEGCQVQGERPYGLVDPRTPIKMAAGGAVAGGDGWPPSDPGACAFEMAYAGHAEGRQEGRLDSFDEAFARRRTLGRGPLAADSCGQAPGLRQVLSEKMAAPRYHQPGPAFLPPLCASPHQPRRPPAQHAFLQQPRYQGCQPQRFPQAAGGAMQQYMHGCGQQELQGEMYRSNTHTMPVPPPLQCPQYLPARPRLEPDGGGAAPGTQLLSPPHGKLLASQLYPANLFWEQQHQAPPSCSALNSHRRSPEEREEMTYPVSCSYCKEQFRSVACLQAHAGHGGCMGPPHAAMQNDCQKALRNAGYLSPHLPTSAMTMKAALGEGCPQDGFLGEATGDFLSAQEVAILSNLVNYSPTQAGEALGREGPPVIRYRSLLRSPRVEDTVYPPQHGGHPGPPHFTPRPMLDPARPGTGLYARLGAHNASASPFNSHLNGFDCTIDDCVSAGDSHSPRINVGEGYQAELPEVEGAMPAGGADHPAKLAWGPWTELAECPETQRRVEDLLNVACSSALPGGGLNREFALHCLSEVNGDTLVALERLLLNSGERSPSHPLADYHYTGSSGWTPGERRLFNKAFALHRKDFRAVHKMVRTKSLGECVEYYYSFKKSLKFNKKARPRALEADEDWSSFFRQGMDYEVSFNSPQPAQPPPRGDGVCSPLTSTFPCKQCGKMFYKIKSRNAHMKIHRQQDWHLRSQEALCPPPPPALPIYPCWDSREGQAGAVAEAVTCTEQEGRLGPRLGKAYY